MELLVPAFSFFIDEWPEFMATCRDGNFDIAGIRVPFLPPCVNMPLPLLRFLHVFRCQECVRAVTLGLGTMPVVVVQNVHSR